jgi:mitogen-activated protein kinase kinase kinase ANP1
LTVDAVQGAAAQLLKVLPAARQVDETPKTWVRGELIGEGAFGSVYSGLDMDTGRLMAVKQVLFRQRNCVQSSRH